MALRGLQGRFAAGRLSRNGLFAAVQGLVSMLCVFVAYRMAIESAGLDRFGVWSLLLAAAAVARIGDVSGNGALARFVAADRRRGDSSKTRDYVHTVVISGFGFNILLGGIFWATASFYLPMFVEPSHLDEAHYLIPWVVAINICFALAYATMSAIDGVQRADLRSVISTAASLVFVAACWILIPRFSIAGLAAAQALQQILTLVLGWLVLRQHVSGLGRFPYRLRRAVFVETTGYALKLNAVGMMALLCEPLAKFGFNHAGGPGLVALYELASRLTTQFRHIVFAAATPLVPAFAASSGPDDPAFSGMLLKATKVAAVAALGVTVLALAAAPLASLALLGLISPDLLRMNAALTAGWAITILGFPIYLAAHGFGELRWNLFSQTIMLFSIFVGVFLILPNFGGGGLLAAIVVGLMASTIALLFGNAYAFGTLNVIWNLRWQLSAASALICTMCTVAWEVTDLSWVLNSF